MDDSKAGGQQSAALPEARLSAEGLPGRQLCCTQQWGISAEPCHKSLFLSSWFITTVRKTATYASLKPFSP